MRQTSRVLYIHIDSLIPVHGKSVPGLDEFIAALDHQGMPAVWLTGRSRLQLDQPRRKLGHSHPFIAEDGCAVYLPEDYFHLRPEPAVPRSQKSVTLRLGRFTCIPVAEALPAALEALETLSEETAVPIVTLRSLSPRELAQNTELPPRDADLVRQRDFDELFFFAGASSEQIERFRVEGRKRNLQLRQHAALWSAALGASTQRCIRELSKLYDRALHRHAQVVGLATPGEAPALFPFCERALLLSGPQAPNPSAHQSGSPRVQTLDLNSPDVWANVLEALA